MRRHAFVDIAILTARVLECLVAAIHRSREHRPVVHIGGRGYRRRVAGDTKGVLARHWFARWGRRAVCNK